MTRSCGNKSYPPQLILFSADGTKKNKLTEFSPKKLNGHHETGGYSGQEINGANAIYLVGENCSVAFISIFSTMQSFALVEGFESFRYVMHE